METIWYVQFSWQIRRRKQMTANGRWYKINESRWQERYSKLQQMTGWKWQMTVNAIWDKKKWQQMTWKEKKITVDDRTNTTNDSRRHMRYNKCQQMTGEYILGCRGWDTRTPHLKSYRIVKQIMSSSQTCPNNLFGQNSYCSLAQRIMSNFAELIIGWFWVITKCY